MAMQEAKQKNGQGKTNWQLFSILFPYYRKNRFLLWTDLFCAGLTTVCDLVLPLLLSRITDTAAKHPQNLTLRFILEIALIYFLLRVMEVLARYYMSGRGHIMGAYIEKDMREDMYRHIQTLPHSFFSTHETGRIISSLTTDLFEITEFSHHCPEEYFIGTVKLLVSFFVLSRIYWPLTLLLFALIPLYFYASSRSRKRLRAARLEERKQIGTINSTIEEAFLGYSLVKSFSNEKVEEEKFSKDNSAFVKIKEKFYHAMATYDALSRAFDGVLLIFILIFGGLALVKKRISPGEFVAFILYAQTLLMTLSRIIEFTEIFEHGMTGLERFDRVMSIQSDLVEKSDAKDLKNVQGHIRFKDVSFVYPNEPDKKVLDQLNLNIEPGAQIAIVGPSGGGKTTIANLIPRFYDVSSGALTIDGTDVRDVTLESLRNQIGMVQQDVYLFSDTIRANIEYGLPGASYEQVVRAAREAGAYEFIKDLPEGFDTYVGEHGVMLSGGQKQRISIARVFLKNPPILILDEATSALDNLSERLIQKSLAKLAKNRTTITIAHRLTTVQNADEIIVLIHGHIEERGNHSDLMKKAGIYSQLYRGALDTETLKDEDWDQNDFESKKEEK